MKIILKFLQHLKMIGKSPLKISVTPIYLTKVTLPFFTYLLSLSVTNSNT